MSVLCQKSSKNGNALVVTVPKAYAHQLNIRDGSQVEWEKKDEGILLTAEKRAKKPAEIDPKVAELIGRISKKYSKVWEDLSKI